MKPCFYPRRNCWRVIVPARFSETGKRQERYFPKREKAAKFIADMNRKGNVQAVELDEEEKAVLARIRSSEYYSPERLDEVWRLYGGNGNGGTGKTVRELVELFYAYQVAEKRAPITLSDDRRRLRPFIEKYGYQKAATMTPAIIEQHFDTIAPGTNRRSIYKSLRKVWHWAFLRDHIATDPMMKMKPRDDWGVNDEIIPPETFARVIRVCAGLELPRANMAPTARELEHIASLKKLVPFFVLGGLAGLRRCEMVSAHAGDPVIEWEDIHWGEDLIVIRDGVAKQTRAKDRKRYIPLEAAARAILEPLKARGRIVPVSHTAFNRIARRRRELMRLKLSENCLRNSYCSYALTFRSSGDVARAMGDLESTIMRFYRQTLKPATGKAWFKVKLDQ